MSMGPGTQKGIVPTFPVCSFYIRATYSRSSLRVALP